MFPLSNLSDISKIPTIFGWSLSGVAIESC